MIKRRQRADYPAHDRHGMRVTSEAVEEGPDLLMDHRVARHDAYELVLLAQRSAARRSAADSRFEIVECSASCSIG